MAKISFSPKRQYGIQMYFSEDTDKYSIIKDDASGRFYIRINENGKWEYPYWEGTQNGFRTLSAAQNWLNSRDWEHANRSYISIIYSALQSDSNDFCDDECIYRIAFTSSDDRQSIMAAINTRNLANNLVRVRSSNVWSYGINVKNRKDRTGDVLVQFKDRHGGPGDLYIYYDVPVTIYRRWQSAPSKGHYFWENLRNNYNYSKLTGNKRGVLPNAIN